MKKVVSIGIPVKDGIKKNQNKKIDLKKSLNSVLKQNYKNLEIIISDDCSNDLTKNYLKKVSKKDKRIKLFLQKKNLGWEKNFQFLMNKSKGEYFKINCQDDFISKDYISSNFKFLEKNKNYTCSSSKFIYENNKNRFYQFDLNQKLYLRLKNFFKIRHISHNILFSLIRRKNLKNVINFSYKYWAIDWIFDLDLLINGKFKTINKGFVKYGTSGISKHKNYLRKENLNKKLIYKIFPFYELMKYFGFKIIKIKKLKNFEKISLLFSVIKINIYFFKRKFFK